jgi:hypothetical protein
VVEEGLPRGETHQGQGGPVGERNTCRSGRQTLGGGEDVLRGGAVDDEGEEADHLVADREAAHALAQCVDRSRDVQSGHVRQGQGHRALPHAGSALAGVRLFLLATLRDRERFVLPLHGGPVIFTPATRQRQAAVRAALHTLLERGQAAGELRADLTPEDLIVATSLLSRPLPGTGDWDALARRQIDLLVDGLAARRPPPADQRSS